MEPNDFRIIRVRARGLITRTKIPDIDFALNQHVGCQHVCRYCYAGFTCRWRDFLGLLENISPRSFGSSEGSRCSGEGSQIVGEERKGQRCEAWVDLR